MFCKKCKKKYKSPKSTKWPSEWTLTRCQGHFLWHVTAFFHQKGVKKCVKFHFLTTLCLFKLNIFKKKVAEFILKRTTPKDRNDGEMLFNWTNLWNKGLISADRSNKATLLLTIPRSLFKSSAKDLSSPISEIMIQRLTIQPFRCMANPYIYDSGSPQGTSICIRLNMEKVNIIASSTDSDLEAFSHYPADGSFAALPGRTAAKTNYLNQRFLSY